MIAQLPGRQSPSGGIARRVLREVHGAKWLVETKWFVETLRDHPEIAVFLALGIGYWVGGKSWKGLSLSAVTATLIAAVVIGQLNIAISANVKTIFFLFFLFAVGYGVGPQFVRGIAKDGLPQALFGVVQCLLCLGAA
jgi:putative transport protein